MTKISKQDQELIAMRAEEDKKDLFCSKNIDGDSDGDYDCDDDNDDDDDDYETLLQELSVSTTSRNRNSEAVEFQHGDHEENTASINAKGGRIRRRRDSRHVHFGHSLCGTNTVVETHHAHLSLHDMTEEEKSQFGFSDSE